MYCCDTFQELARNLGNKGFSVVPVAGSGPRHFRLMSQSGDIGPHANSPSPEQRYVTKMQTGIAYCPACGTKLADWIESHLTEFERAAADAINSGKYTPSKW